MTYYHVHELLLSAKCLESFVLYVCLIRMFSLGVLSYTKHSYKIFAKYNIFCELQEVGQC